MTMGTTASLTTPPRRPVLRQPIRRGVAAIELALLMVLFWLPLTFGVVEVGRAIYEYNAVAKSTRDAARYLSQFGSPAPSDNIVIAQNLLRYGSTAEGTTFVAPGLAAATIPAPVYTTESVVGAGTRQYVRVEVLNYPYTLLLGIFVPFLGNGTTFTFGPIGSSFALVT